MGMYSQGKEVFQNCQEGRRIERKKRDEPGKMENLDSVHYNKE